MKLAKIPKREWSETFARFRDKHYYIARVFVEATEEHRAAVDEFGNILGAVSYSIEPDHVHVYSLGSRRAGAGSRLMAHVERLAAKRKVSVRLAADKAALGFYLKRGYRKLPFQRKTDRIVFVRKSFT